MPAGRLAPVKFDPIYNSKADKIKFIRVVEFILVAHKFLASINKRLQDFKVETLTRIPF